jgi:hypothetical protein
MLTVALLITTAADETRLVPVAPESVFTDHWQRGCSVLGLEFVPLCQAGTEISQEGLPSLLDELSRLQRWMESPGSCIPEEGVLQRICILISELEQLRGSTAKIWLG